MILSESQTKLLKWLVENFPEDSFKLRWISSDSLIESDWSIVVPNFVSQARLKALANKDLLVLHVNDFPPGHRSRPISIWDIEIQPEARNLVTNNFWEPDFSTTSGNWPRIHTGKLANLLNDSHNSDEMLSLCMDLGISRDHLKWDGQANKTRAIEIVEYCVKHKILLSLLVYLVNNRPSENWNHIIQTHIQD